MEGNDLTKLRGLSWPTFIKLIRRSFRTGLRTALEQSLTKEQGRCLGPLQEMPRNSGVCAVSYHPVSLCIAAQNLTTSSSPPLNFASRIMKPEEEQKGLGDPILLEKIDKLFAGNVGEYISLPQIVVVGDQSSGKSSVLAGLMRLPFARDSGLCTRLATQIIFRRSVEEKSVISIIPTRAEYYIHKHCW